MLLYCRREILIVSLILSQTLNTYTQIYCRREILITRDQQLVCTCYYALKLNLQVIVGGMVSCKLAMNNICNLRTYVFKLKYSNLKKDIRPWISFWTQKAFGTMREFTTKNIYSNLMSSAGWLWGVGTTLDQGLGVLKQRR